MRFRTWPRNCLRWLGIERIFDRGKTGCERASRKVWGANDPPVGSTEEGSRPSINRMIVHWMASSPSVLMNVRHCGVTGLCELTQNLIHHWTALGGRIPASIDQLPFDAPPVVGLLLARRFQIQISEPRFNRSGNIVGYLGEISP